MATMDSRARKILELVLENVPPDPISPKKTEEILSQDDKFQLENTDPNAKNCIKNMDVDENLVRFQLLNADSNKICDDNISEECLNVTEANKNPVLDRKLKQNHLRLVDYDSSDSDDNTVNMTLDRKSIRDNTSSSETTSSSSSSASSTSSSSSDSDSSDDNSQHQSLIINKPSILIEQSDSSIDIIENTPPQKVSNNNNNDSNNCAKQRSSRNIILNYRISPKYTDESDIDLSDEDPTFINEAPVKTKNLLFAESSSREHSASDVEKNRGRKRKKCPSKWKQNKIKRLRNQGKSYQSMSKTQKKIPARCLQMPCTEKCRLKCTSNIDTEMRFKLFEQFWGLGNLTLQRTFIRESMTEIVSRYKYTNAENPRCNNNAYHFTINNKKVRVCKTFFKATLNISDRMIFTVQHKVNQNGFVIEDHRGRHQHHRRNDPELLDAIRAHINSIPKIESHYLRAQTTRNYIDASKNINDLYNDFKANRIKENKAVGHYMTYYKVFTTEFNISFYKPKKDQCDLCTAYNNSTLDEKLRLEEKYNKHNEEKVCSRVEKKSDRKSINNNCRVVVYDLQAVMQCPQGNSSSFYYRSKLNCFNFTVTELKNDESKEAYDSVHSYFWTETDAKRGAIEIGSCVWEYLKALSEEDGEEKEVIFYSDNCCGQNKNKYMASLYMFAVQNLGIKSITHKFLIRGHTQNEADSVHGLIEKEKKKYLKSSDIYTPDQYVALIKSSKKTPPALKVHEMTFKSFYDLKQLQEEWGYNFSTNTEGSNVNWNDIKILKITKANPTYFYYKASYKDDAFKTVNVRNKRKKMSPINEIKLQPAYTEKHALSANKKKDLKELLSGALIPAFYKTFYDSIL